MSVQEGSRPERGVPDGTTGGPRDGISRRAFAGWLGAVGAAGLGVGFAGGAAADDGATATAAAEGCWGGDPAAPALHERPFVARGGDLPEPPNVLVVLADDLGWADLSCYGHPTIRTPRVDRLAREGVRFTHGYAGSSVCSPTRFSLYTGRYPGRLRGGLDEPIGAADPQIGLPPTEPTLASLLKDAGYETAMFGKWHCGSLPWFSPTRSGWDEFFGNFSGAVDYFSKVDLGGEHDLYEGEVEVEDLGYYTHLLADRAVEWVSRRRDRPWLLNLNFTTPHWPWEGPEDKAVSDEITRRMTLVGDLAALPHLDGGSLETYQAMVEDMDASVGRVLDALEETGQARNTLVVLASDNGGERWSNMWPLSGGKLTLQEGGIRVPTVVRWPAAVDGGQVSTVPVTTPDWTATVVAAARATPPRRRPFDGVDLSGWLVRGDAFPEHDLFWRLNGASALRRGRWKFLAGEDVTGLFDVVADPRERVDRSEAHPLVLDRLRRRWDHVAATLLPYPD